MCTSNLWLQICSEENFQQAWNRVRANPEAPGTDRLAFIDFEQNLAENLSGLRERVQQENYHPIPGLNVSESSTKGTAHALKIPAVPDRIVQEALLLRLEPIFKNEFLKCTSYHRSATNAVKRVARSIQKGRHWVLYAHIDAFFDNVDRALLLEFVREKVPHPKILKLVERCIHSENNATGKGLPPETALAPLLTNIYLHRLDQQMLRGHWHYFRHVTNLIALAADESAAQLALKSAQEIMADPLGLALNREKTRILHVRDGFVFSDYHFDLQGQRPASPAIERFKAKIAQPLQRAASVSATQLKTKLASIIQGWASYFHLDSHDKQHLKIEIEQKLNDQPDSLPARILTAALALHFGDKARARELIETAPISETDEADLQFQWGVICELAAYSQEALDAYLWAFRLDGQHPEAAFRLGLYYLNQGQLDKAIRFLRTAIQVNPNLAPSYYALGLAYQHQGFNGPAQAAFNTAFSLEPKLRQFDSGLEATATETPAPATDFETVTQADLDGFLRLFSAREGVFARQWTNATGQLGYSPVYQPLTASAVKQHLEGRHTLGIYLRRSDNTVSQMMIHLALSPQARREMALTPQYPGKWSKLAHTQACALRRRCQKLSLPAYIEHNGAHGRRLWLLLAEPIPARAAIAFLKKLLEAHGEMPPELTCESFPKVPQLPKQALGSLVQLPLGIHPLTQQRCLFLDEAGEPLPDPLRYLRSIQPITRPQFYAALEQLKAGQAEPALEKPDTSPVETLLEKCNVLRYLVNKAEQERHLEHLDRLVLLYTLGFLGKPGEFMLHQILRKTSNYDPRVTQRWLQRLKGTPVSCPKIREWHRQITPSIGCSCRFPDVKNSYPSPVLHLDPNFIANLRAKTGAAPKSIPAAVTATSTPEAEAEAKVEDAGNLAFSSASNLNQLVDEYIKLRRQLRTLQQQVTNLENQLQKIFDQQQCDRMELQIGTLRRVKSGEEVQWLIEI